MSFIETVSVLLNEKGISINKMLCDLNLGKGTFATWKKRGTIPKGDILQKIADYFDVSVDYLLGKTPSPEREDIPEDEKRLRDLLSQMSEEQLQMAYKIISAIAEQNNDNK